MQIFTFAIQVLAVDDSFPPRTGTTTLQVNVLDANDHVPSFEWPEYDASVREGVPVGSTVITVKATDQDTGRNAEVEYSIVSTTAGSSTTHTEDAAIFRIDSRLAFFFRHFEILKSGLNLYFLYSCYTKY